ncbi:transglycosylase SLT domain-containing protein [Spirosoma litoris]
MALAYETKVPASYRMAFIEKVKAVCSRLGINPDWLMIVMDFESAGTFSPSVTNKGSGAVGLIQFTESGIVGLGVTLAQLKAMTAIQQLDYVEKYLTPYKSKFATVYDVYLAVFAPAYLGKPDEQVVYTKTASTDIGKRRYELNKALDTNGDGNITIWEIKQVIRNRVPITVDSGASPENKALPILALVVLTFLFLNRP